MNDGSRHRVYKRFFRAAQLAREIAGGEILHEGHWFVVVAARKGSRSWPEQARA
jgi:hypothetical protein